LNLFIASRNGEIEVVKELLNRNANIEAKNNAKETPLFLGLFFNFFNHIKYFLFY
jgi:hypothetical protein